MAGGEGVSNLSNVVTHSPRPHHHRLCVNAYVGALHLFVALELSAPWTVIFGHSGSGKSTLLRAACGLLPNRMIEFSQRSSTNTWLEVQTREHSTPPHLRSIAYAPQGAVLFPHLTVRKNIAFAADATSRPSPQLLQDAISLFDLTALVDRMPLDLSGGERQRVNLARAFAVPNPTLFLLDEPFTGIDRAGRARLIPILQQRIAERNTPVLSVTHDVEEALLLRAEVIRLEQGSVTAQGPANEVLAAERTNILRALDLS